MQILNVAHNRQGLALQLGALLYVCVILDFYYNERFDSGNCKLGCIFEEKKVELV